MRRIGWDTETALIIPGCLAPPMTCMSFADEGRNEMGVVDRHEAYLRMRDWLRDPEVLLIAHNAAFDVTVMSREYPDLLPLFFDAYEQNRVEDTMLREQLLDIANGSFRWELDPLTDEPIKRKSYALGSLVPGLDKSTWRTGYGLLRDVPVDRWEKGARDYAILDSVAALHLYKRQDASRNAPLPDSPHQARSALMLHLMATWGMRTDEARTASLKATLEASVRQLGDQLMAYGLIREDGRRDMAAIRQKLTDSGITLSYTPTGQIQTGSEALKLAAESTPEMSLLVTYAEELKILSTYVPALEQGITHPINARYNPLVETGRTSCSKPNLQNLPRGKKDKQGNWMGHGHLVREAFIPREGNHFVFCDYDSLEVRSLGQVLFETVGGTTLRDAYQANPNFDPHTRFAALLMGITEDEALQRKKIKDPELLTFRQNAKAGVFGYPGGMGPRKMREYAHKNYEIDMTEGEARALRENYFRWLPEIRRYHDGISRATEAGSIQIEQLRTGRKRGGVGFSDCANGWFQGLAGDGAKKAGWDLARACYVTKSSPLYGCRPVVFIHDEYGIEAPIGWHHEAAVELENVMNTSMRWALPDVPVTSSSAVCERWYKGADKVVDANGRFVPWRPKKAA
jgi:DNA polymerase I-like protein with 3'-5' exonuclease and polymerase domains